ncbi:hypothetical protein M5K25_019402 [Dendrobium thyrsiflorum]|uniref:Uncharacterized protein n=1 Tax=Dendrobium thyrsiflorum TaxID=117978 RepID=A0ABD0ULM2_DENTH
MGRPVRSHIRSAIKGIGSHLHTSMDDNMCNLSTVAGFPHPIHQLEWGFSSPRAQAPVEKKGPNWLGQHTRSTSASGGTRAKRVIKI